MSNLRKKLFRSRTLSQQGFTLIEMIVVVTITSLITGTGFFSFIEYSRTQTLNQAVEQLKLSYTTARNNALSNVKPQDSRRFPECVGTSNRLEYFQVTLATQTSPPSSTYSVMVKCTGGVARPLSTETFTNVELTRAGGIQPCSGVTYRVLNNAVLPQVGTSNTLPCSFFIRHAEDPEKMKEITIEENGFLTIN